MRVWSEIYRSVVNDLACRKKTRIIVLYGQLEGQIRFVILEDDIIFRGMLFYQVIFKKKCLFFIGCQDKINQVYALYKQFRLCVLYIIAKIAFDPVADISCLAHINYFIGTVFEDVYSR